MLSVAVGVFLGLLAFAMLCGFGVLCFWALRQILEV
jgi:hypothetical protein